MNSQLYQRLIDVAAIHSTVNYSDLADFLGLDMSSPDDRLRIGEMLDEINHSEHEAGRPISAVVVHSQEGLPGAGFFVCARELGALTTRNRQDELAFFVEELRRVHAYWGGSSHRKSRAHPQRGG
jgi:hypothetical protein